MTARTAAAHVAAHRDTTENQRFKARARSWSWAALAGAAAFHYLVFAYGPGLHVEEAPEWIPPARMQAVIIPREVDVPEPEARIAPPALPVVPGTVELVEDIVVPPPALELPPLAGPVVPPPPAAGLVEELRNFEHFMPYMVMPELVNRRDVERTLRRQYPRHLEAAGIGGAVLVWFWIDEEGTVQKYEIKRSSGHDALDEAAVEVIEMMRFRPALNRGRPVRVIVALPIRFEVR